MSQYKWVRCPVGQGHPAPPGTMNIEYYTSRLFDIGINADGSLHNPNGYPPETVRAAVLAVDARRHERRSQAGSVNPRKATPKADLAGRKADRGPARNWGPEHLLHLRPGAR
jgi:hypothetical protein